jgi:hypothetical protein
MSYEQGALTEREMLSTLDLLIKVVCYEGKGRNIFSRKSTRSKLVCARRSTVSSHPLQYGFPACNKLRKFIMWWWGQGAVPYPQTINLKIDKIRKAHTGESYQ